MKRTKRVSSYALAVACLFLAGGPLKQANSQGAAPPPMLDYNYFKAKVEPVFLQKRPGHTRCVVCHSINNAPLHLVRLSPGATSWNEEQSRQNFQLVQKVVVAGDEENSRLTKHPLAEEAGGDPHHGGGQQFGSKNDPAWQTLRDWVKGAKLP
jgi:hypothetical protein